LQAFTANLGMNEDIGSGARRPITTMLLLAIVTAQALDPARIVVLGIIFGLAGIAANRTVGRLGLGFGAVVVALAFPYLVFGQTGMPAQMSALAGLLSNAIILAVLVGLARLWRSRFV